MSIPITYKYIHNYTQIHMYLYTYISTYIHTYTHRYTFITWSCKSMRSEALAKRLLARLAGCESITAWT